MSEEKIIQWDKIASDCYDAYQNGVCVYTIKQTDRGRWLVMSEPPDMKAIARCWDINAAFKWVEDEGARFARIQNKLNP